MSWTVSSKQYVPADSSLVFAVDAGYSPSYPGSGTTWADLTNTNNAVLTNGPTYDSANGGSIVFDGINDHAITSSTALNLSGAHTISAFVSPDFASSSSTGRAIFDFSNAGGTIRSYLRWEGPSLGFYWDGVVSSGNCFARTTTAPSFSAGSWIHICVALTFSSNSYTNAQFYVNGNSVATTVGNAPSTIAGLSSQPIKIGLGSINSYYWKGKISTVSLFTKTLAAGEVLSLFNLYKGRYGL